MLRACTGHAREKKEKRSRYSVANVLDECLSVCTLSILHVSSRVSVSACALFLFCSSVSTNAKRGAEASLEFRSLCVSLVYLQLVDDTAGRVFYVYHGYVGRHDTEARTSIRACTVTLARSFR